MSRPRIAVFAGPNATVLNSEPLVTSDKARRRANLGARTDWAGRPLRFDVLRPQRLAAPVTVYVEQFSAHPLEADAAGLYAPPDGYVGSDGAFHQQRLNPDDVPVYAVELRPEDGLYPLPYMALQADGRAWDGDEADPFGPPDRHRQPFYPDAERLFEEIDRLGVTDDGTGGALSRMADFAFLRPAPPGGYVAKGEQRGRDYFPYRPVHLIRQPSRRVLARIANGVQRALGSGNFFGGLWLEGSPFVEETAWWLNLLIDTTVPIAACASQRPHGAVGNDGDRNIIDAVTYLTSGLWADEQGRDALGTVVVMDQQFVTSRSIQKGDARPGGYSATGGHGGVLGTITSLGRPTLSLRPLQRHTWSSAVRLTNLPEQVTGVRRSGAARIETLSVPVRNATGDLLAEAIPVVGLVKHGQYSEENEDVDPGQEVGILARIERNLARNPLSGLVAEGSAPYGSLSESAEAALRLAAYSGIPVVKVGRGNADGVTESRYAPYGLSGGNLTATKARLLLMACLLKFGALPPAADPANPTAEEDRALQTALSHYREAFDQH